MCGEGVVPFGSHADLYKVIASADGTDTVVEHVLLLIDTFQHGGDAFFGYIRGTHHLRPLLAGLLITQLQVFVQFCCRIDRFLLNAHTEFHVLADILFNRRIIRRIDGHVRNGG